MIVRWNSGNIEADHFYIHAVVVALEKLSSFLTANLWGWQQGYECTLHIERAIKQSRLGGFFSTKYISKHIESEPQQCEQTHWVLSLECSGLWQHGARFQPHPEEVIRIRRQRPSLNRNNNYDLARQPPVIWQLSMLYSPMKTMELKATKWILS